VRQPKPPSTHLELFEVILLLTCNLLFAAEQLLVMMTTEALSSYLSRMPVPAISAMPPFLSGSGPITESAAVLQMLSMVQFPTAAPASDTRGHSLDVYI